MTCVYYLISVLLVNYYQFYSSSEISGNYFTTVHVTFLNGSVHVQLYTNCMLCNKLTVRFTDTTTSITRSFP